MGTRSPYNSEGTEHLYASDSTPVEEAKEIARLARSMRGVNTHRKSANEVFNPGDDQTPSQLGAPRRDPSVDTPGVSRRQVEYESAREQYGVASPQAQSASRRLRMQQNVQSDKPALEGL